MAFGDLLSVSPNCVARLLNSQICSKLTRNHHPFLTSTSQLHIYLSPDIEFRVSYGSAVFPRWEAGLLHCSSILSGANATTRKVKKVSQLLEQHEASIQILTEEFGLPAVRGDSRILTPGKPEEGPLPEDVCSAEEKISKEYPMDFMGKADPEPTLEASLTKPIIESFESAEKDTFDPHVNIPHDLDDPHEPVPEPDGTPTRSAPAEDTKSLIPPSKPASYVWHDSSDDSSRRPSAPSSTVISVRTAAAPKAPIIDSHTIAFTAASCPDLSS